jgi:hypothetical protein
VRRHIGQQLPRYSKLSSLTDTKLTSVQASLLIQAEQATLQSRHGTPSASPFDTPSGQPFHYAEIRGRPEAAWLEHVLKWRL